MDISSNTHICLCHKHTRRHIHPGLNPSVIPFVRCKVYDNTGVAMRLLLAPVEGGLCNGAHVRVFCLIRGAHLGIDDNGWPSTNARRPSTFSVQCNDRRKRLGSPLCFSDTITLSDTASTRTLGVRATWLTAERSKQPRYSSFLIEPHYARDQIAQLPSGAPIPNELKPTEITDLAALGPTLFDSKVSVLRTGRALQASVLASLRFLRSIRGETLLRLVAHSFSVDSATFGGTMNASERQLVLGRPSLPLKVFTSRLFRTHGHTETDVSFQGLCPSPVEYGVLNAKDIALVSPAFSVTSPWSYVFNFVWVGWSSGGLHFDEMDNILSQVRGSKEIVVFPAESTCRIDGNHYPAFNGKAVWSSETRAKCPQAAKEPFYHIKLAAGDAVLIPSGAYHAPLATSHDSTSVNSFLAPALTRSSWPNSRYGRMFTADGLWRYSGAWLGYLMKWFSLTLVKERAYGYY